ncbi:MAG TPA: HDOD domain-containing protein [Desulfosporosinus sp.]|nr:HDOD domain-containing protein [Desulfosporosinus sp.]
METFVARQPIIGRNEKIFAYELLFRQGNETSYSSVDGDKATGDVISNSFLTIGIDTLTGGKRAFINFTASLLKNRIAYSLPKEYVGIEILENVEPDQEIILACKQLKEAGYLLVLDDFVFESKFQPLIELVDVIKVDFLNTDVQERRNIIRRVGSGKIKFLAEKVETRDEFEQALHMGYSYFQGYYFHKPVVISGKAIPMFKLNYLRLMGEINNPNVDFDKITSFIKGDVSLSYNLLKFINSSVFCFKTKINSIKQALVLLGLSEVRKWASMMVLQNLGEDKPNALIVNSVVRATFGEALALKTTLKHQASNIFLMGMFSLIDAFLDRPLVDVLAELPLTNEIKKALLGEDNTIRGFLDIIIAYEKGDWVDFSIHANKMNINESEVPNLYLKALASANQFTS